MRFVIKSSNCIKSLQRLLWRLSFALRRIGARDKGKMFAYSLCLLLAASSAASLSVRRDEYKTQSHLLDLRDAYRELRDTFRGASIKIHLYDELEDVREKYPDDYYYPPTWMYPYPLAYPTEPPTTEQPTKPTEPTLLRKFLNAASSKTSRRRIISQLIVPNHFFGVSETQPKLHALD